MKALKLFLCVAVLVTGVSCSRDPEVVKRKYLESGNKYFAAGKYKEANIMYRNAIRKDRKFGEAYYRLGLTQLKLNQPPQFPYQSFMRAADSDPRNIDARIQAGKLALTFYLANPRRNETYAKDTAQLADEIIKLQPKNTDGLRMRAYYKLLALRNPEEAYKDFKAAYDVKPLSPDVTVPLVETMFALKQDAEAEKIANALIEKNRQFGLIYDVLYAHYVKGGRPADAERILVDKAVNNPKDSDAIVTLATHYQKTNRAAQATATIQKLIDNPKDFPDGRMEAGNFYLRMRDLDTARKQFEEGLKQGGPDRGKYYRAIATTLIAQRRPNEAQRLLDEAIKADPKDEDAKALRSSLRIETGDPKQIDAAIAELEVGVKENPKNPVTRFNYARALSARKLQDQARTQLQEAIKLAPQYIAPRLALGELYYIQKQYGLARQTAREILDKVDSNNLQAKLLESSSLASAGDRDGARRVLADILKDNPGSHDAQVQLAILDLGEKKYPTAEQQFAKLYQSNQADLRGLMGLVETYAAQQKYDEAIRVLKAEVAKHPDWQPLRIALGNVSFRAGRVPDAIGYFQQIAKLNPGAADIYLKLGECYRIQGDVDKAIASYTRARDIQPDDPFTQLQLGVLYDTLGRRDQAKPVYETVLKLQPDNVVALNNLAYLIAESGGDLDQALMMAQRAKQRMPDHPDVSDTLGWIYIKKNLSDSAVQVLRDLVSKQPDRSTYRYHLGLALYQKGDKAGARRELTAALERKPSKDEEGKIRALLGKIG